jgi:hypothetical protein
MHSESEEYAVGCTLQTDMRNSLHAIKIFHDGSLFPLDPRILTS